MTHLVNTLQFEVICPDEHTSFNIRQNFAQTFQPEIAEVINEVCSKYVNENESIKFDKLELDIGAFNSFALGNDFKNILRIKFESELTKQLSKIPTAERQASRQLSQAETLMCFLLNGTLPWWAGNSGINPDEICAELADDQVSALKNSLYENRFNRKLWRRILWQLNDASKALIVGLLPELMDARNLFSSWISVIGDEVKSLKDSGYIADFSQVTNTIIKNAAVILSDVSSARLMKIFEEDIEQVFKKNAPVEMVNAALNKIIPIHSTEEAKKTGRKQAEQTIDNENELTDSDENPAEKYIVKNAGIVLLAPFLKPFFKELDLLDGNKWKNMDATFRAVQLLGFLATGEQKSPEYSLTLEKVLCGLPVNTPLPLAAGPEEKEIEESQALLKAILSHWTVLKNTSVDGLRQAFLKRDGLLSFKEDGWLLQVERKTMDVLLDNIPWGYSTITFGWNRYLVFVEW